MCTSQSYNVWGPTGLRYQKLSLIHINHFMLSVLLDAASGGAFDWAKQKAGVKYSYTLELRPDGSNGLGFIIDETNIEPSGKEIYAAIKTVAAAINA